MRQPHCIGILSRNPNLWQLNIPMHLSPCSTFLQRSNMPVMLPANVLEQHIKIVPLLPYKPVFQPVEQKMLILPSNPTFTRQSCMSILSPRNYLQQGQMRRSNLPWRIDLLSLKERLCVWGYQKAILQWKRVCRLFITQQMGFDFKIMCLWRYLRGIFTCIHYSIIVIMDIFS